jgi:hypothetical protein
MVNNQFYGLVLPYPRGGGTNGPQANSRHEDDAGAAAGPQPGGECGASAPDHVAVAAACRCVSRLGHRGGRPSVSAIIVELVEKHRAELLKEVLE